MVNTGLTLRSTPESQLSNGAGGNQTGSWCHSIIDELQLWISVAHPTFTQPSYSLQQCGNIEEFNKAKRIMYVCACICVSACTVREISAFSRAKFQAQNPAGQQ
jgi:hypothetical protein